MKISSTPLSTAGPPTRPPISSHAKPDTIRRLEEPLWLKGIAGGLLIDYVGIAKWETPVLDKNGDIMSFQEQVIIHKDLPNRLLSPQAFLSRDGNGSAVGNVESHCRIYHNRAEWYKDGRHVLTMDFDTSFLPQLTLFKRGKTLSTLKSLNSIVHSSNANLSTAKKLWLKWHDKLGHISFKHVLTLALGGFLDRAALALHSCDLSSRPTCAACQYGKQVRTPDHTTITKKNPEAVGSLKAGQLVPGDRVFCDQLESRVRGRLLRTAGREPDKDRFCGSTAFCDAASGLIWVEHQVTLSASDTVNAKDSFEHMSLSHRVSVNSYHTDNGIFKSKAFVHHIASNYQDIRYSGVGAKWQNGVAESAIGLIVSRARTMMIHAALHWPKVEDETLWSLAVSYSAHLYNHTPNSESGISPIEIFSRTTSDGAVIRNAHVWGAPSYVLEVPTKLCWRKDPQMETKITTRTIRGSLSSPCRKHMSSPKSQHRVHQPTAPCHHG